MKHELSTVVRRAMTVAGAGLLEAALRHEARKGCGAIVSSRSVPLEPPYVAFDGATVMGLRQELPALASAEEPTWVTLQLFTSPDDLVPLEWQETLLRATAVFPGPLAFEVAGANRRVAIRLAIPDAHVSGVVACLRGLFPAFRLREVHRPFQPRDAAHPLAFEELVPVPPYHRTLSLIGKEGVSPLNVAYRTIADLAAGELGLYQVLLQPCSADHDWGFNIKCLIDAERRASEFQWLGGLSPTFSYDTVLPSRLDVSATKKVEKDCAMYAVVCRYAVWASEEHRTAFMAGMRGATNILRFGNHAWRRITSTELEPELGAESCRRMVQRRQAHRPGLVLTSHEVASFFHFPNEWSLRMFMELERREGLEWQPSETDARPADVVLGFNHYAGGASPVVLPGAWRCQHGHIIGAAGFGKSECQLSMMTADAAAGQGFCLIDPHSDLSIDVLARLPEERLDDLVYLTFSEAGFVPAWNPFLSRTSSGRFADDFTRAFLTMDARRAPRMSHIVRHAAFAVHRLRGNLQDFVVLLSDSQDGRSLRQRAANLVRNPEAKRFWEEEFPTYRGEELHSVKNKLSQLFLHDQLVAMFSQRHNTVDPRDWMDTQKIVIVNLAAGLLGEDFARFLGGLLCSLIYRAALSRADVEPAQRTPFYLYLDECQLLQSGALVEMLAEARKYGLGVTLAHQELNQLDPDLLHALGNCFWRVVFRPGQNDLSHLRRTLLGRVDDTALGSLARGEAFAAIGNHVTSMRTEKCQAPILRDGRALARALAEQTYAPAAPAVEDGRVSRRQPTYDTFEEEP